MAKKKIQYLVENARPFCKSLFSSLWHIWSSYNVVLHEKPPSYLPLGSKQPFMRTSEITGVSVSSSL